MKEKNSRAGPLPQGKKGLEWRKESPLARGSLGCFTLSLSLSPQGRGDRVEGWSEVTRSR